MSYAYLFLLLMSPHWQVYWYQQNGHSTTYWISYKISQRWKETMFSKI